MFKVVHWQMSVVKLVLLTRVEVRDYTSLHNYPEAATCTPRVPNSNIPWAPMSCFHISNPT